MKNAFLGGAAGLALSGLLLALPGTALADTQNSSASATISAGTLSLTNNSAVGFGTITLTGAAQQTTISASCGGSPNGCVEVKDATGSGNGWKLQVSAGSFTNGAQSLASTALQILTAPTTSKDDSGSTLPSGGTSITYPLTVGSSSASIVSAGSSTGMGGILVAIPYTLNTTASTFAGSYTDTITYTLASAP